MRTILASGVLVAAVALAGPAANFSGKWAIQTDPAGSGGATVLTLNQVGDEVTGTIDGAAEPWTNSPPNRGIWAGKVEGNTLSFYVWRGTDQPAKVWYRGALSASGDEIAFSVTRAGTAQQEIARRVK
jgi:hypothetical protein